MSADGMRGPIALGVAASAGAQYDGGVVRMGDGAVTFKGGSIGRRRGCCGGRAAARCTRAQTDGGVLIMAKGAALFDTVAISDTRAAGVRVGRGRNPISGRMRVVERVWADGVRVPIVGGKAAPAVRRVAAAWLAWPIGSCSPRLDLLH